MKVTLLSLGGCSRREPHVIIKFKGHIHFLPPPISDAGESNLLFDNAVMSLMFLFKHICGVSTHTLHKPEVCRHCKSNATVISVVDKVGRMTHSSQWPPTPL